MRVIFALAVVSLGLCGTFFAAAAAEDADPEAGRLYAVQNCTNCHNVTSRDASGPPWKLGPSFAAVAKEKTTTAIGLSVFLQTPHATMPNIIIPEQDRRNIIAYILTLKPANRGNGT